MSLAQHPPVGGKLLAKRWCLASPSSPSTSLEWNQCSEESSVGPAEEAHGYVSVHGLCDMESCPRTASPTLWFSKFTLYSF